MLKPSMIRGKTFETVKNGYDPDAVNSFLAEMADSVSELITENADNEEKIIKLVEKINEYRADEDAIRIALVSAQKESARVISEAQAKSEEMIDSAKTEQVRIAEQSASECERIIKEHKDRCAELIRENTESTQAKVLAIRRAYEEEKEAYEKLKAEITYFKSDLTELYKKQLLLIMDIPEVSSEELAKYEKEEMAKLEELARLEAEAKKQEEQAAVIEETVEETAQQEAIDEFLNTGSFEPVIPKSNYTDLKFGKNN